MEFVLENEDTTNPVEVEDDAVLDQTEVVDEYVSDDDLETSEEAGDGQPEDDSEEIDYEGNKYKVPKALKDGFLRQADYTRKTQEVAEERKALATRASEVAQQAEILSLTSQDRANLTLVDQELNRLANTDWSAYDTSDPQVAAWVAQQSMQYAQLEAAKRGLEGSISKAESEYRASSERIVANAISQAGGLLAKEVDGWSTELANNLMLFAANEFGVSGEELRDSLVGPGGAADTRTFKVLARLYKAEKELSDLKSKQSKSAQAAKLASVQPARAVGGKTSGYRPGLDDSLPVDEWMRRRNAQVAKAAGR